MNDIVKEVYQTTYGTAYEVYKEAVKINNSIILQAVKDYLSKREDKQVHIKNTKHNSLVSSGPLFEMEIDVMDVGSTVTNLRYVLVAIDNFTKIGHVVPMQNKQPDENLRAVKEVFTKIGIPKQIHSDEEGSFNSPKFIEMINENKIKDIPSFWMKCGLNDTDHRKQN